MKSKMKKGFLSAVGVVAVILLAAAVNVAVTRKDFSIDLTENQVYTLSDQTREILDALDREVTVYIINSESEVDASYQNIFNEYRKASDKIKLAWRDPELYPDFVSEYAENAGEVGSDSAVVVCGDKSRLISSSDYITYSYGSDYTYSADSLVLESLLTEAIHYVVSEETSKVYALTGHSESELSSGVISSFEGDNYSVETLDLSAADAVPDDCEVLLINGAQTDISKKEKKKLKAYMDGGGKMYVFLDASAEGLTRLDGFLKKYQVGVQPGVVVETESANYTQYPIYLLPDIASSEVTQAQYDSNVYILVPSAKGLKDLSGGSSDAGKYTVTPLLTTSEGAYSKVNTDDASIEKAEGDVDGPFDLSVAVSDESGGRLIVTGCVNMLEDSIDTTVGGANTDFVLNGINYLAEQETRISIEPKSIGTEYAVVPESVQKAAQVCLVFGIPFCLLVLGLGLTVYRRKL